MNSFPVFGGVHRFNAERSGPGRLDVMLFRPVAWSRSLSHLPRSMLLAPLAVLFRAKHVSGLTQRLDSRHAKFAVVLIGLLNGAFDGEQ